MIRRWVALVVSAIAVGLIVAYLVALLPTDTYGTDTRSYLAAGERLNAGHGLYGLVPGDRPVFLNPPFWSTPLVSPPTIAVLWRPLAAMPDALGACLWWLVALAALLAAVAMLWRRQPLLTSIVLLVVATPAALQIAAGNINSLVLLGLVLVWRAWVRQRDLEAGAISGVMAAVKLTPAVMMWWLLVTGRRRAFGSAAVSFVVVWLVSLVGAGVQAHLDYIAMLRDPASIGVYPDSVAGMAMSWGVPEATARLLPWAIVLAGLIAVWLLRERPAWSFDVAVLTMVFGSPVLSSTWFILLLALLAPIAYPVAGDADDPEAAMILAGRRLVTRLVRRDLTPPPQEH